MGPVFAFAFDTARDKILSTPFDTESDEVLTQSFICKLVLVASFVKHGPQITELHFKFLQ